MPSLLDWLAGLFRDLPPQSPAPAQASRTPPVSREFPPDIREDARFGTLTRNAYNGWFGAPVSWAGVRVPLELETRRDEEVPAALRAAGALWDDEAAWNRRILDYAAEQFLDARNRMMQQYGHAPIEGDAFTRLLRLTNVYAGPDDEWEFVYDATEAVPGFGMLRVCGSLHEGPTLAEVL
jgi:hypothetical protein